MHVVVGLGNPGSRYAATRHNIGFMVVDRLAASAGGHWREDAARSQTTIAEAGGAQIHLVKPQAFMNRSGDAVAALRGPWGFEPEEVLVVFDDFYLDFGRLRLRRGGSDGGHNGLASVLQRVGTEEVPRLRMGIGRVPEGEDDIDFVLTDFGPQEQVEELVDRGCRAVEGWVAEGIEAAMNRFNGCPAL